MSAATALRAAARGTIGAVGAIEGVGSARASVAAARGAVAAACGTGVAPSASAPRRLAASGGAEAARGASIRPKEAAKFAGFSDEWWDPSGPFAPLHAFNPIRAEFLARSICDRYGREFSAAGAPLAGLRVLDVGCGGGILAHTLAQWGASVVGVDVNAGGIEAARRRAARVAEGRARDLSGAPVPPFPGEAPTFRVATVETIAAEIAEGAGDKEFGAAGASDGAGEPGAAGAGGGGKEPGAAGAGAGGAAFGGFHAVIASEVIEHVSSPPSFADALADSALPGGVVLVTTMNRTPEAYALCIVAAEKVLRWVPEGTHDWKLFWTPEELCTLFERGAGLKAWQAAGFAYDPLKKTWSMGEDLSVNYGVAFAKASEGAEGKEGAEAAQAAEGGDPGRTQP